jgi:hypothetical protein
MTIGDCSRTCGSRSVKAETQIALDSIAGFWKLSPLISSEVLCAKVERNLAALQLPKAPTLSSEIAPVSRSTYRNRVWVTRPRPGVDRVMSAWLIRKFIDPKARFAFATDNQKASGAVPFDMYEGGFGHRGEDCTFETLTKAFRIKDKHVVVIGEIVHDADIFDDKFGRKEGFGVDEVMKGWAKLLQATLNSSTEVCSWRRAYINRCGKNGNDLRQCQRIDHQRGILLQIESLNEGVYRDAPYR